MPFYIPNNSAQGFQDSMPSCCQFFLPSFLLSPWDLNSGPHAYWAGAVPLESLCQPCFVLSIFKIGSLKLFARGWFQTLILLIFASHIAQLENF
jgi:hypothetical protein